MTARTSTKSTRNKQLLKRLSRHQKLAYLAELTVLVFFITKDGRTIKVLIQSAYETKFCQVFS